MDRLIRLGPMAWLAVVLSVPAAADPHPAQERGFSLERAFHTSDLDSINPLSGNLLVTLKLAEYSVSPHLSYSLVLTHNGSLWEDDLRKQLPPCDPDLGCAYYTQMHPETYSNSGLGWLLSLGSLHAPFGDNTNRANRWMFRAADGSEHIFEPTLHSGETSPADVLFSRDNSYLRLRLIDANDRRIELPSGNVYFFNAQGRLTRMEDRFGNYVSVNASGSPWTITDSHGRSHLIHFNGPGQRVSSVVLAAFDGSTATYSFGYTSAQIRRDCRHGDPELGNQVWVELLTSVSLPDGSQYSMPATDYVTTVCSESGRMRRMRLPTLGYVQWTYGYYTLPSDRPYWEGSPEGAPPAYIWWEESVGVRSRTLLNASAQAVGTWTFDTQLETGGNIEDIRQLRNTVTDPLGNRTEHYFSVYASELPNPPWHHGDYGLPFTRYVTDATGTRFLSTRVYAPNGTLLRTTFVAYERDPPAPTADGALDWKNANRRLRSTRTVYHDDGDRYAEVTHGDFDGLGHYRSTLLGGSFGSGDARTTVTHYNPTRGTYPGSFVMLTPSDPWVLETFDHQRVIEGGVTSHRVDFCFNPESGFLDRKRTRRAAGATGAGDLLAFYQPTSQGQVWREWHYGGDLQPLSTGDACTLGLPASPQYRLDHTYQFGGLRTSQFIAPDGTAMPHFHVHRDIDPNTGFIKASRDVSGLQTDYLYDPLGRMTWERPASGHDGWTQYLYSRATSATARAKVEVLRRPNGSTGGTPLARRTVEFDAFGRPTLESRLMADGTWQSRETLYDALGWKTSVSEWGNTAEKTFYLNYDPFGRPGTVRPPDGSAHDVSYTYLGDREVRRTVRVGTAWNGTAVTETAFTTTERFDRQGRLWQVVEPSGPSNANVTTTYTYDAGGKLSRVSATSGGTTQNRYFTYDERGFLLSEQHPEKGAAGNGLVQYVTHDPLGNPRRKLDGPFDLRHVYDAAGRLTHVREPALGNRLVQHFVYGTSNSGSNRRLGRLQSATRYNYVSIGTSNYIAQVRDTYTYAGRGGRVSRRDSDLTVNGVAEESFYTTWTYNDLGEVSALDYPRCQAGGCAKPGVPDVARTVTYTYTNGWLTAVGGSATYASSITYHPNGTVNTLFHGNGVSLIQELDPDWMGRPYRLRTDGALNASGAQANWNSEYFAFDGAGNVTEIGNSHFLYDGVSRVKRGSVWTGRIATLGEARVQDFTYDAFGNLTSIVGSNGAPGRSIPVSAASNRLTGVVHAYDAAGNLTLWNNAATYVYGPFGDMGSMTSGAEDWRYIYGADGERFWSYRVTDGGGHWALRDLDGKVLRVFGANWAVERDYVYREGKLLAAHTNAPSPGHLLHYHNDHLGTPRFITRADRVFLAYHAYYPYGEEATAFNQDTERMKFTGHERDLNSLAGPADDLDYMHARYHNPQLGRFLSVDPASESGKPAQPQSWNRYAYAQGNPLKYIDPDGEALVASFNVPDFEKNANLRGIVRHVLTGTFGSGAAMGADAALSMVLPASPEEFQGNLNASMTGVANPIGLGGRVGALGARGAGTVWSAIRATQPLHEGTVIPRSFELATANGKVWVHGNVTKHLMRYANAMLRRGVSQDLVDLASQQQLRSLQAAVEAAIEKGIPYGQTLKVGGWELSFAAPGTPGHLPILFHAVAK